MKTIGIFIGRMNPLHLGHINIINESLKNDYKTIVFLGSSNILDSENPYNYEHRKKILKREFKESIIIDNIDDTPDDKQWIISLGKKIYNTIGSIDINLNFYCGDKENDYAIQVINKYKELFLYKNNSLVEIPRNLLKINDNGKEILLSSTLVRVAINNGNKILLQKIVGLKYIDLLK